MRLPLRICEHNIPLEKNLRCSGGYIQAFLKHAGRSISKNFGIHTKDSHKVATIFLHEKYKEILEKKIGIAPELPRKRFEEAVYVWFELWSRERKPNGKDAHSQGSRYKHERAIRSSLIPAFGSRWFDELRALDVYRWRHSLTDQGMKGTTINKYQSILGSVYSHTGNWTKTGQIKEPFRQPPENPCLGVEMTPGEKREIVLSKYEAGKLKNAFMQLNDPDGWDICKMALKTVLSLNDLKALQAGKQVDIVRSKTGVTVDIPITALALNWYGWRTRWEKARELAGLQSIQFRDLRKTGINWAKGRHDLKLISEYAGHVNIKTTEKSYTVKDNSSMEGIARDLEQQVEEI